MCLIIEEIAQTTIFIARQHESITHKWQPASRLFGIRTGEKTKTIPKWEYKTVENK